MIRVTALLGAFLLAGCAGTAAESPAAQPGTVSPSATRASKRLPQGTPFDVTAADLTIHSFEGKPQTGSGGFRMSCFPLWRQVEPKRGEYNWPAFDIALDNTEKWGAQEILFTFCGTPQWAASKVADPDAEVFGPGSTAAPKDLADFEAFARAVVRRYKGRIGAYETWNEATSPQFWQGTPEQMAEMTEILRRVVRQEDPDAVVTSASIQTHRADFYDRFVPPYLKALKARNWPVDVWNGHFYPEGKGGPAARRKQIAMMRRTLADAGAPKRPLWDTEVNYYTNVPGTDPAGRVTGPRAAAWAVRTYLDGWRLNLPRNYWYFWSVKYEQFPGIQTRAGDPATTGLARLAEWTVGSRFNGCEQRGHVVRCAFVKDGRTFYLAWADGPDDDPDVTAQYPLQEPAESCELLSGQCTQTRALVLDEVPVKVQPA